VILLITKNNPKILNQKYVMLSTRQSENPSAVAVYTFQKGFNPWTRGWKVELCDIKKIQIKNLFNGLFSICIWYTT
jgi:hypothetical protein